GRLARRGCGVGQDGPTYLRIFYARVMLIALAVPLAIGAGGQGGATAGELPHHEQVAPGVFAAGFDATHGSANCGWVALERETLLVDLPRGVEVPEFLAMVEKVTGKPARTLVLTRALKGDAELVKAFLDRGIRRVFASPATRAQLRADDGTLDLPAPASEGKNAAIGDAGEAVELLPFDGVAGEAGAAVFLPGRSVLFGGPVVVNGPRVPLPGSDTGKWVEALRRLEALRPSRVIPGNGSWGGPDVIARQRRFLAEFRRQVGYEIAQGRPLAVALEEVRLPAGFFVWMPYDTPLAADIEHVYRERTVPVAPFGGQVPDAADRRPHALVLIGDGPHEPGHIEEGLRPVFEATGVVPHFAVDVRSLSAGNLAKVRLLVILRDGLQRPRPGADHRGDYPWMTPEQERAVVEFVEKGGGLLNLHNALGLYPPGGPYLSLVGGRYTTHGPLERFRVEVVDANHPITRGVSAFVVADEQHLPAVDEGRIHLLLRSRSDAGQLAAAGWVREQGRGRVGHLAPGHTREALLHPTYQRLLRNAVHWCARIEDTAAPGGG
ncbi:MAG: ThuA domain-containing protein, partial [Isosphaeraceae bacterium]